MRKKNIEHEAIKTLHHVLIVFSPFRTLLVHDGFINNSIILYTSGQIAEFFLSNIFF